MARPVAASCAAHPDAPWGEQLDGALLAEVVTELDPRRHRRPSGQVHTTWQQREQAFHAHLEKLLRPALHFHVCVVLFNAIEQMREPGRGQFNSWGKP
jgi:hypothetical protein